MTTHLTDTQKQTIRIALARWRGWKLLDGDDSTWEHPDYKFDLRLRSELPDPTDSLDACHEIEVKLTDKEHKRFEAQLRHLTKTSKGIICSDKDHRDFVSASAEHRSLALFRALNLGELGD